MAGAGSVRPVAAVAIPANSRSIWSAGYSPRRRRRAGTNFICTRLSCLSLRMPRPFGCACWMLGGLHMVRRRSCSKVTTPRRIFRTGCSKSLRRYFKILRGPPTSRARYDGISREVRPKQLWPAIVLGWPARRSFSGTHDRQPTWQRCGGVCDLQHPRKCIRHKPLPHHQRWCRVPQSRSTSRPPLLHLHPRPPRQSWRPSWQCRRGQLRRRARP